MKIRKTPAYHKPIGISNTLRGASMSVKELMASTSLNWRRGVAQDFLLEKYPNGVPEESILDEVDLSQTPLDLTDAERLVEYAQKQIRERYEAQLAERNAFDKRKLEDLNKLQQQRIGRAAAAPETELSTQAPANQPVKGVDIV